jgi:hypothetical protein
MVAPAIQLEELGRKELKIVQLLKLLIQKNGGKYRKVSVKEKKLRRMQDVRSKLQMLKRIMLQSQSRSVVKTGT